MRMRRILIPTWQMQTVLETRHSGLLYQGR
jgi:hypothetical protein